LRTAVAATAVVRLRGDSIMHYLRFLMKVLRTISQEGQWKNRHNLRTQQECDWV